MQAGRHRFGDGCAGVLAVLAGLQGRGVRVRRGSQPVQPVEAGARAVVRAPQGERQAVGGCRDLVHDDAARSCFCGALPRPDLHGLVKADEHGEGLTLLAGGRHLGQFPQAAYKRSVVPDHPPFT